MRANLLAHTNYRPGYSRKQLMRLHHHSANSLINRLVPSRQIENCLTKFLYLRRAIKNTKTVDPSHHCTSSQKLWSAVCLMLLKDQVYRLVSSCQHSFSHGKAFVRYATDRGVWLYWALTVELDMGGGRGGRRGGGGGQVDIIYLDVCKAFDKASR